MSLNMRDVFEALLPDGAIWKPAREGGGYDRFLDSIGECWEYLLTNTRPLAYVRDPSNTDMLSDLEREHGVKLNANIDQADRRAYLSAVKYARLGAGSQYDLLHALMISGFSDDIAVWQNVPGFDPGQYTIELVTCVAGGSGVCAGNRMAVAGYMRTDQLGELVVNGDIYTDQESLYIACAGLSFMFAGSPSCCAGYYTRSFFELEEYRVPDDSDFWQFVFYVGGMQTADGEVEKINVQKQRKSTLKDLILKIKPIHSWCILRADHD